MSVSQRYKMRELVRRFGNNDSAIIREYGAAEMRGEIEGFARSAICPPRSTRSASFATAGIRDGYEFRRRKVMA